MSWMDAPDLSEEERKKLKRQYFFRRVLRGFGRFIASLVTRTTVTGHENIPADGPVLFAGNHMSTYDAAMMLMYLPQESQILGPGDFKLLWPANVVVENIGVIMVKRGTVDRVSMKAMEKVLKSRGMLGLFPEGGTWEKGIEDVKSGAAYLSMTTKSPVVPIAIGGTYQVWNKILRLQRPEVTFHFCEPMPAMQLSGDRKKRQQELQAYSIELMQRIYKHLPPADQRMYDEVPLQEFRAELEFMPVTDQFKQVPALPGLTELISKPNLFSPLHRNAGLPLDPFTQRLGRFTPAHDVVVAIKALQAAFENDFKGYLEYRLGEEKAQQIYDDLAVLLPIAEDAARHELLMRVTSHVSLRDTAPDASVSITA